MSCGKFVYKGILRNLKKSEGILRNWKELKEFTWLPILDVPSPVVNSSSHLITCHFPSWTSVFSCIPCHVFFSAVWSVNRALARVLCTFCRQLSQIEARTHGNTDPTSATPGATMLIKTQGFPPEIFHPWFDTPPGCYTSYLLDDAWLTWWCGWHDTVNANHDHCP